jgi:hypothetical protein
MAEQTLEEQKNKYEKELKRKDKKITDLKGYAASARYYKQKYQDALDSEKALKTEVKIQSILKKNALSAVQAVQAGKKPFLFNEDTLRKFEKGLTGQDPVKFVEDNVKDFCNAKTADHPNAQKLPTLRSDAIQYVKALEVTGINFAEICINNAAKLDSVTVSVDGYNSLLAFYQGNGSFKEFSKLLPVGVSEPVHVEQPTVQDVVPAVTDTTSLSGDHVDSVVNHQ